MSDSVEGDSIGNRIVVIRGRRVLLDRHLAELYGVETRVLNQAVRRNRERFPADFLLNLSREEILRVSQSVISLKFANNVFAFTEQGVAMLSSVLGSDRAIQVNIAIMRAFVRQREMASAHRELAMRLGQLESNVGEHGREIRGIFEAIRRLMALPEKPKRQIGFHPQVLKTPG